MNSLQASNERQGGFAYDFEPEPAERFQCPICFLVLRDPVQTHCGHHFCQVCIHQWLGQNTICPIDRKKLTMTNMFPDVALKREILGLNVRCPNSKQGCDVVTSLQDIRGHFSRCNVTRAHSLRRPVRTKQSEQTRAESNASQARTTTAVNTGGVLPSIHVGNNISCPFCDAVLYRNDLEIHIYMCDEALLPCPNGCETMARPSDMDEHLDVCPKKTETCSACGWEGFAVDIQNHRNVCSRAIVTCQRCGENMQRLELSGHSQTCGKITCPFCNVNVDQNMLNEHIARCDPGDCPTTSQGRRDPNIVFISQAGEGDDDNGDRCFEGWATWQKLLVGVFILVIIPALFSAEIAIGVMFYNDCPGERRIPIYLLVSGVFGCLSIAATLSRLSARDRQVKRYLAIAIIVLFTFMFAWFIAGSVWVYRYYPKSHPKTASESKNTNPTDTDYCDTTLFNFAFGTLTAEYGLIALGILIFLGLCISACCSD